MLSDAFALTLDQLFPCTPSTAYPVEGHPESENLW